VREQDLLDWDWVQANRSTTWARLPAQALARRARSNPNDPVLGDGRESLTAAELAQRVAGVAAQLLESETDRPVVVLVDWSLSSAIAILGVQWSGRCVIPLNSSEPRAWLAGVLDRIGECTVADATGMNGHLFDDRTVLDISRPNSTWVDPVAVRGDTPSLVIFTSGSTGVPKGVIRLGWQDDVASIRIRQDFIDEHRSAVLAPLNWIGGLNVLRSKLGSGYLCVVDPRSMSASALIELMRREHIEVVHLTPSLAESLNHSLSGAPGIDSVSRIRLIGEAVTWSSVRAARALGGPRTVVCATYAASESLGTIARTEIDPDTPLGVGRVPIGQSTGDHIRLEPLTEEQPGVSELTVHRWVSHGYWGDPESTQRIFARTADGDPMFHSGDLVDVDAHGMLWFVGRKDDVIKISGKLVNPSETTAALLACQGVRRVLVLSRTLSSGRKQLIAHVEASADVDPDAVRRQLASELPAHLIPAVLVRHDQLPLANGGKIDRQRLSSEPLVQWRTRPRVEPRSDVERFVLIEASRQLGLPDLGVDDDLWSFGLDSLGAIELSETLARALSSGLTVNDFIGASTVAAVAKRISETRPTKASNVVTLVESDGEPTMFIMTGAGSPALRYRELAQGVADGKVVIGFQQWGLLQRTRPDRSITAAARRNVRDIVDIAGDGPLVLIGHSWGGLVAHDMAVRLAELGREVVLVVLDSGRPRGARHSRNLPLVLQARDQTWLQRNRTVVRWRAYSILRPRLSWLMRDDRFQRFFWRGIRTAQRHRARVFNGPMLVVQAEKSTVGEDWLDQSDVRVVTSRGDHLSMCHSPHVHGLVDIVNTFVMSYRGTQIRESGQQTDSDIV